MRDRGGTRDGTGRVRVALRCQRRSSGWPRPGTASGWNPGRGPGQARPMPTTRRRVPRVVPGRGRGTGGGRALAAGSPATSLELESAPSGSVVASMLGAESPDPPLPLLAERQLTYPRPGAGAADHPRPEHGRAELAGDGGGLQGGAPRRGRAGKILPMLSTAAGTLAPARALILGAGVAGLHGHRHRPASGRGGGGLRRARRGPGAGAEPQGPPSSVRRPRPRPRAPADTPRPRATRTRPRPGRHSPPPRHSKTWLIATAQVPSRRAPVWSILGVGLDAARLGGGGSRGRDRGQRGRLSARRAGGAQRGGGARSGAAGSPRCRSTPARCTAATCWPLVEHLSTRKGRCASTPRIPSPRAAAHLAGPEARHLRP